MVGGIQECLDSVKRHNPTCDIRLYSGKDLPCCRGASSSCTTFPNLAPECPLVAKTDLLRHQKLFQEGGYYIDADCYCLKPLDFDRGATYGVQEPSPHPESLVEWAMGSEPGHPTAEILLQTVQKNIQQSPYNGYLAKKELAESVKLSDIVAPEWAGSRYFGKVNRSFKRPTSATLVHLFLTSWVRILDSNWPPKGCYRAGWPKNKDVLREVDVINQW